MMRALMTGLLLVGALASGCGDDGAGSAGDGNNTSAVEGGDDSGDAGGPDDSGDAGELPKFCELLSAEQVTEAVGAAVTLESGPFDACEFDQEDVYAVSGSLGVVEVGTDNGGFESYRSGAGASLDNAVEHPIDGVGEQAFVTTGSFGGSENLTAGGGALVDGGRVYTVNLAQASGMSEEELVTISENLLRLLVEVG